MKSLLQMEMYCKRIHSQLVDSPIHSFINKVPDIYKQMYM